MLSRVGQQGADRIDGQLEDSRDFVSGDTASVILDDRIRLHPCPFEHRNAAELPGVDFHERAFRPVDREILQELIHAYRIGVFIGCGNEEWIEGPRGAVDCSGWSAALQRLTLCRRLKQRRQTGVRGDDQRPQTKRRIGLDCGVPLKLRQRRPSRDDRR